ncbi:MAG: hypothetical protein ACR2NP_01970, partial [Pirellulaceae bacterium]
MNTEQNGQNEHEELPGDIDLTSFALEELNEAQAAELRAQIADNNQASRVVEQTRRLADVIEESAVARLPMSVSGLEQQIEEAFTQPVGESEISSVDRTKVSGSQKSKTQGAGLQWAIAVGLLIAVGGYLLWQLDSPRGRAVDLSGSVDTASGVIDLNKRIPDISRELGQRMTTEELRAAEVRLPVYDQLFDLKTVDHFGTEPETDSLSLGLVNPPQVEITPELSQPNETAEGAQSKGLYSLRSDQDGDGPPVSWSTSDNTIRMIEDQVAMNESLGRSVERIEQEGPWGRFDSAGRSAGFRPEITPSTSSSVAVPDGGTVMLGGITRQTSPQATRYGLTENLDFPADQQREMFLYRSYGATPNLSENLMGEELEQLSEDFVTSKGMLRDVDWLAAPGSPRIEELLDAYYKTRGESATVAGPELATAAESNSELAVMRAKVREIT